MREPAIDDDAPDHAGNVLLLRVGLEQRVDGRELSRELCRALSVGEARRRVDIGGGRITSGRITGGGITGGGMTGGGMGGNGAGHPDSQQQRRSAGNSRRTRSPQCVCGAGGGISKDSNFTLKFEPAN